LSDRGFAWDLCCKGSVFYDADAAMHAPVHGSVRAGVSLTAASMASQQPLLVARKDLCEGKIVDTIVAIRGWIGSLTMDLCSLLRVIS
jgi:hypothetical protein